MCGIWIKIKVLDCNYRFYVNFHLFFSYIWCRWNSLKIKARDYSQGPETDGRKKAGYLSQLPVVSVQAYRPPVQGLAFLLNQLFLFFSSWNDTIWKIKYIKIAKCQMYIHCTWSSLPYCRAGLTRYPYPSYKT